MIKYEGLFIGVSCGFAMIGGIKYLKKKGLNIDSTLRCVVVCPDGT